MPDGTDPSQHLSQEELEDMQRPIGTEVPQSTPTPEDGSLPKIDTSIIEPEIGVCWPEKSKIRTKESEARANLGLWQRLGVVLTETEVREAVECLPDVEGFEWIHVVPKGMKMSEIWKIMATQFNVRFNLVYEPDADIDLDTIIQMPRQPEKTYAVAARYSGGVDAWTREKTPLELEETGKAFMTPLERAIAELRWNAEWRSVPHKSPIHLDLRSSTMCPGSRTKTGYSEAYNRVPGLYYAETRKPDNRDIFSHDVYLTSSPLDDRAYYYGSRKGAREVITEDTKIETMPSNEQEE